MQASDFNGKTTRASTITELLRNWWEENSILL